MSKSANDSETRVKSRKGGPRSKSPGKPRGGKARDGRSSFQNKSKAVSDLAGLNSRRLAASLVEAVLRQGRSFDDAFARANAEDHYADMAANDRAFARLIATTTLRNAAALKQVLNTFLQKPLNFRSDALAPVLLIASAQLLVLKTPPHAVINLAVEHARKRRATRHLDKLTNAVLRKVADQGPSVFADLDLQRLVVPDWLWVRWSDAYGEDAARDIASVVLATPPLDISVKSDPETWATKLGGALLSTGSIRLESAGRVEDLPGYCDGSWWVQDAAAAMPTQLLGDVSGKAVLDLCAAPGGKTAALASQGANVTAVDVSDVRLQRLQKNLKRLNVAADVFVGNAETWQPDGAQLFDAVLVDVPCTATGTVRRHPDIFHLKRAEDVAKLQKTQSAILANAARFVKEDGLLMYCTCSLEPEECEMQIEAFLSTGAPFVRVPIAVGEAGIDAAWLTSRGELRTRPDHMPRETPEASGLDGFFAARLRRVSK